MKDIITYISESSQTTNISKKEQEALIKKNKSKLLKFLTAEQANLKDINKDFEWIDPEDAGQVLSKFEGKGYNTKTPLDDQDCQDIYDALDSNGGWWFDFKPKGMYNKKYHKCIIVIINKNGKKSAIMMRGYDGCWTMSGEDYVNGSYSIEEINLD